MDLYRFPVRVKGIMQIKLTIEWLKLFTLTTSCTYWVSWYVNYSITNERNEMGWNLFKSFLNTRSNTLSIHIKANYWDIGRNILFSYLQNLLSSTHDLFLLAVIITESDPIDLQLSFFSASFITQLLKKRQNLEDRSWYPYVSFDAERAQTIIQIRV